MILNKNFNKNNYKLITEKYLEWMNCGINPSDILVLTFNSISKNNIIKSIFKSVNITVLSDIKVNTFNGIVYNAILDNWGLLENLINNGKTSFLPHLSGLEISQFILKNIIKEDEVKGYNSKKSLLHQLFRRYSLIVKNNLTSDEIKNRSKILKEAFSEDAYNIITKFKTKTLNMRTFDNMRQSQIFGYIYKNTDYFSNIKYLIIEDADELTPLCLDFIKSLSHQLLDKLIILDKEGGSRCGYLCAEQRAKNVLENIFNEHIVDKEKEQNNIIALKNNIINSEKNIVSNILLKSLSKRVDMIDSVIDSVNKLIDSGIKPSDIALITPVQDKMLKYTLKIGLKYCNPVFISGNEKLIDNKLIKAIVTILKMSINKQVDEYELRLVLSKYLNIPASVLDPDYTNLSIHIDKYNTFCKLIDDLKQSSLSLSEKAYYIYSKIIKNVSITDIKRFCFFLKELQSFEQVFGDDAKQSEEDILIQLENSIISDNPYSTLKLSDNDLIISTPQKIIDNKITTKYQFWLDVSSQEWNKSDIGPLYNSWVFQKSWENNEYTLEDNIYLSKLKTYKVLRKLILSTHKIFAFSSLFDTQGVENFGGIDEYLITQIQLSSDEKELKPFNIVPRADQLPVLNYSSGTMAISAVPGAGKTTILLALIIQLLKKDVSPENIYVLTYMESAARNFKERIKSTAVGIDNKLPNITTIHGLALRIIKENSNYERLGLNSEFEICDDTHRGSILRSISSALKQQEFEEFDRAISVMKLAGTNILDSNINKIVNLKKGSYSEMKMSRFLKFYIAYQNKLKYENLIDYDDILILAVKLLEENSDILEYYQKNCEYIIEDEAQDSSSIQQKLINLLCKKNKNLIRCGDVNQAITTTFTNADVEGFKEFIETSECRVDMNCSQRCSEGIYCLANKLVEYGNSNLFKPFYEIYMRPVEAKNPTEDLPVIANIYKDKFTEKNEIVKEIKEILNSNPNATIGILLRNNHQVNSWAEFINNSGLIAITRNECLAQKKIFRVIFSILEVIATPYDNKVVADAYKTLSDCGFFKPNLDVIISEFNFNNPKGYVANNPVSLVRNFISLDNDDIYDSDLAKFHWDMNYWLSFPEASIDELATMIGLHYFSNELDKANIHLIATLCAKLDNGNFLTSLKKLEDLSQKPNLNGFKFFSEEDSDNNLTNGRIQIMTLHKSKGDEFDYVFLPQLSEKNLSLDIETFELKKNSDFIENIKSLNNNYLKRTHNELKEFLIKENYRLLYVAITRAKNRIYLSVPQHDTYFGKQITVKPSLIFDLIEENVNK